MVQLPLGTAASAVEASTSATSSSSTRPISCSDTIFLRRRASTSSWSVIDSDSSELSSEPLLASAASQPAEAAARDEGGDVVVGMVGGEVTDETSTSIEAEGEVGTGVKSVGDEEASTEAASEDISKALPEEHGEGRGEGKGVAAPGGGGGGETGT